MVTAVTPGSPLFSIKSIPSRPISAPITLLSLVGEMADDSHDPGLSWERYREYLQLLALLQVGQRVAVELRYLQGCSVAEIVPRSTVARFLSEGFPAADRNGSRIS